MAGLHNVPILDSFFIDRVSVLNNYSKVDRRRSMKENNIKTHTDSLLKMGNRMFCINLFLRSPRFRYRSLLS